MISWKDSMLCSLLDCGVADLEMLEDIEYDIDDILDEIKELDMEPTFSTIMGTAIAFGLRGIDVERTDRIAELEAVENERELDDDEKAELEALRSLNPEEDAEVFINYLDTHVWWRDDDKGAYEVYLQAALDRFCEKTGIEIG